MCESYDARKSVSYSATGERREKCQGIKNITKKKANKKIKIKKKTKKRGKREGLTKKEKKNINKNAMTLCRRL